MDYASYSKCFGVCRFLLFSEVGKILRSLCPVFEGCTILELRDFWYCKRNFRFLVGSFIKPSIACNIIFRFSGLLVSYQSMKRYLATGSLPLLRYYIHRYIRYTHVLALLACQRCVFAWKCLVVFRRNKFLSSYPLVCSCHSCLCAIVILLP